MQHPQQRHGERTAQIPQDQPPGMHNRQRNDERDRRRSREREEIGHQQREQPAHRQPLDTLRAPRTGARNGVVGVDRHEATGHRRDHEQDDIETELHARPGRERDDVQRREMKEDRRRRDQREESDEEIVAPIARLPQRDADAGSDGQGERDVGDGDRDAPRRVDQHASGQPQDDDSGQCRSGRRRTVGPVANDREQEPGDDGERVAEDQLMGMPRRARVPHVGQVTGKLGRPRAARHGGEDRRHQIERTKAQLPEREAALLHQLQLPQQLPGAFATRTRQPSGPCSR